MVKKNKISRYLSYSEIIKSYTAIKNGYNNIPNPIQLKNIELWGINIFDPIREFVKKPLGCASIFRCSKLNDKIGGSIHSQHCANFGAAGDIDADIYNNSTNEKIFRFVKDNLDFDQMIIEGLQDGRIQWVHISYVSTIKNRNKILMMYIENGKTHYEYYSKVRFDETINKYKK